MWLVRAFCVFDACFCVLGCLESKFDSVEKFDTVRLESFLMQVYFDGFCLRLGLMFLMYV